MRSSPALVCSLLALSACAEADPPRSGAADGGDSGASQLVEGCRAAPQPADRARVVLANLPYDGDGDGWAVLDLTPDGALTDRGDRVSAGRAFDGRGASTPDGSLLLAAQDDGTLAVFAVDAAGAVSVVEPGWAGGPYVSAVAIEPSGERAWLMDGSRGDVGGGVYAVELDCDTGAPRLSTPGDGVPADADGLLWVADHPVAAFFPWPGEDRAVLVAQDAGDVQDGADVALVAPSTGEILARADAFGDDDDAWLSTAAWSAAHSLVLVGDASGWSSRDNAVAAVRVDGDALTPAGAAEVYDPAGLAAWGDHGVVSSAFGDALHTVAITDTDPAVSGGRPLSTGASPQLPAAIAMVERGPLAGRSLVTEVGGLRQVQVGDGVEDLGVVALRDGAVPGGIVLQR